MKHIVFFLLVSVSAIAQDTNHSLDSLLKSTYKADGPGATTLVAKGGQVIYRKALGMADMENNVSLTPEHVFEIGSITKQFTAVSILMLMEQGKLTLEDPVTKFIAGFPNGDKITIHHLLTHTSGIKSYTEMERWTKLWRNDMTPIEMIDLFKNEPVDFAPGEKYQYNNSAYFMLGYIIEKASGTPYPQFLEKNIFEPLGLKNTYYGSQAKIINKRAQGYQRKDGYVRAEYLSLTQPYAAGSIMSNVDDLFAWHKAVQANTFVKKESIQKAFTDYKLNNGKLIGYGYGWGFGNINLSPTIEHSGGIFGYTTNAIYLPKEDVFVVVFTNCDCADPGPLSRRMAGVAIGKPYPKSVAKITLDAAQAKKLIGIYDFEDETTRMITEDAGVLYSQRTGGSKSKLLAQDKTHFLFEDGFTTMEFTTTKGKPIGLIMTSPQRIVKGVKSAKPLPVQKVVSVDRATLEKYAGEYDIVPGFSLIITMEGDHLMSQATGQGKFELFAESPTRFFFKVVDAQIEFLAGEGGKYDSIILFQGGSKTPGKRK